MRIGVSLLLLFDLASRALWLKAHYSDLGFLPTAELSKSWDAGTRAFCFHGLNGSPQFQVILFVLAAACALALGLGWHTRWMSLASWLLLLSLHHRNRLLYYGADAELRMLLFWGSLLPWGQAWSLDARAKRNRPESNSWAAFGYMAQMASLYLVTGLQKLGPQWFDGTAVTRSLAQINFQGPLGDAPMRFLLEHPGVGRVLTWTVLGTELLIPLLLLSPFRFHLTRRLGAILVVVFQLGVGLCMNVGYFPLVSIVGILGFLGTSEPDDKSVQRNRVLSAVSAAALALISWFSFSLFTPVPQPHLGGLVAGFGFDNRWSMFAEPLNEDGWFVAVAVNEEGQMREVFREEALNWQRPDDSDYTGHPRWTVALLKLYTQEWTAALRPAFCHWLRRRGGVPPNERVELIWVYRTLEGTVGRRTVFVQTAAP